MIRQHERARKSLVDHARDTVYDGTISYSSFVEELDDMWRLSNWHYRYGERLRKLLNSYRCR